jgi:myo-inositol 2-dehydrogenase / D-chiro-inositol 1-dehydrogenase
MKERGSAMNESTDRPQQPTRRQFLQRTALLSGTAFLAGPGRNLFAAGSDRVGVAIVGCGDRGTEDLIACLQADPAYTLVAAADMFRDQVATSMRRVREALGSADRIQVTPRTTFLGFDAYREVLALPEVQLVMLTTPPGFRPSMAKDALAAGKHLFLEKPGGVDPVGVRTLYACEKLAEDSGLNVACGFQQRWMAQYIALMDRVRDGQIGEVTGAQAYWIGDMVDWHYQPRRPEWSDMEWQIRTWPFFTWLSGDCYVEQIIHNLDVMNWMMGANPVQCLGQGGRAVRTGPEFGNIYDHFTVEYEYPNGIRTVAMSGQLKGVSHRVFNRIEGRRASEPSTAAPPASTAKTPGPSTPNAPTPNRPSSRRCWPPSAAAPASTSAACSPTPPSPPSWDA